MLNLDDVKLVQTKDNLETVSNNHDYRGRHLTRVLKTPWRETKKSLDRSLLRLSGDFTYKTSPQQHILMGTNECFRYKSVMTLIYASELTTRPPQ